MRTELKIAGALVAIALLQACDEALVSAPPPAPFGEANRQTMMAQVVNPAPCYEDLNPPTSGEHAADAVERYRNDRVKQPESVDTASAAGGGGQ